MSHRAKTERFLGSDTSVPLLFFTHITSQILASDLTAPTENTTGSPDALDRLLDDLEQNPEPEDDDDI